ncbi:MAG TPA: phosphotransferase [Gaiellaceae bacterium]|nr:phosphotransferase [Gaiellaceae bacterium]
MLTEPRELDRDRLARFAAERWRLPPLTLEYLAVGFGSHHWDVRDGRGGRWFLTVDDLEATWRRGVDADDSFAALAAAFATAAALAAGGLEFVVAPLAARDGGVVQRLGPRWSVALTPYVEGESSPWGRWESEDERRRMAGLLGRLHAATPLAAGGPRRDDLEIQSRAALEAALVELARPWRSGPLAEPARELLAPAAPRLRRRLAAYDRLAARVRSRADLVVTHGEPHRANVLRTRDGFRLVDWDTTLLAQRERDLAMVLEDDLAGWEEYAAVAAGGGVRLDRDALRLYGEWWALTDVAVYVAQFRLPHADDEQSRAAFAVLAENLR